MTEVMQFPPGVRTGNPFSTAMDAVTWIHDAAAGKFGPIADVMFGIGPKDHNTFSGIPLMTLLAPIYPPDTPHPPPPWSPEIARALASDPNMVVYPSPSGEETAMAAVTRWRVARGAEILVRSEFDAADKPDRPAWASRLGKYESLVQEWDATVTAVSSRWVTTAWRDALNSGAPTVPDPSPFGPSYALHVTSPVGTIRLPSQ